MMPKNIKLVVINGENMKYVGFDAPEWFAYYYDGMRNIIETVIYEPRFTQPRLETIVVPIEFDAPADCEAIKM